VSWLEARLRNWLKRRHEHALMKRYGGIQWCPWCRQCAQSEGDWRFDPWEVSPTLDVLTCGVCGGTSIWLFAPVMIYMGALNPPMPAHEARIDVGAFLVKDDAA
jgi:hypothetical protein